MSRRYLLLTIILTTIATAGYSVFVGQEIQLLGWRGLSSVAGLHGILLLLLLHTHLTFQIARYAGWLEAARRATLGFALMSLWIVGKIVGQPVAIALSTPELPTTGATLIRTVFSLIVFWYCYSSLRLAWSWMSLSVWR